MPNVRQHPNWHIVYYLNTLSLNLFINVTERNINRHIYFPLVVWMKFTVQNIVASSALGLELELYTIAAKIPNVEYEPEQFPGAILKLNEPKSSLLLFKNGKVICTGTRSEKEVKRALKRTLELLKPYGKKTKEFRANPAFAIQNIVASSTLGLELDLYNIASSLHEVEYEPEQFPGAILKLKDPKSSLLLFKNGKVICTGTKSEKEVDRALKKTLALLKPLAEKK
ncbi:TATA-box-binding protein [Candidatus Micrarchaeota archaeon CG_4_10_14_0_2_um_filter_49_7]|nr:MAG: TATA-box-binding protein [Candidatus Micrarchaeota archaeon CG_4_10_14_0_2_um_filter_49_7]